MELFVGNKLRNKGKLAERQGRKAMSLMCFKHYDSQVAKTEEFLMTF